jgi:hypothetical protein
MFTRRRPASSLDDVVEYLRGIAIILMEIDAKLESVGPNDGGSDDEEEAG